MIKCLLLCTIIIISCSKNENANVTQNDIQNVMRHWP
jgi:hypothetical protein